MPRKGNWKKGGRRPRFHESDGEPESITGMTGSGQPVYASGSFQNNAMADGLAGLKIGGEATPDENAETLPEPPAEQPIV